MAGSLISVELYDTLVNNVATGNKQKRKNGVSPDKKQQLVVRLPVSLFE